MSSTTTTTTTTDLIPRGPITATLVFYSPPTDNSAPYNYVESPPPGLPARNFHEHPQDVLLTDIRSVSPSDSFTLDKHAFQVLTSVPTTTTAATFDSDTLIHQIYYPEVVALLHRSIPSARKIVIFDHTIRRQSTPTPTSNNNNNNHIKNNNRQPVHRAHVDQTAQAALDRVRLHLPTAEAAAVLATGERYRIVNVWRPINGAVESSPLAFAEAGSVADDDLVPVEHRYPHRTGQTMAVKYNAAQRWMYLSGMGDDERLLLKCSDTETGDGVGRCVPHTAFWDPRTREGAKPRESIEVRALVIG